MATPQSPPTRTMRYATCDVTLLLEDLATSDSLWDWMQAVVRGIGLDPATGCHLRSIFLDAGLPEPEMNVCASVGGGLDFPGYDFSAESLRSMLLLILKLGIATADEVDIDTLAHRLRAELVGAWTSKH